MFAQPSTPTLRPQSILVVDDHPLMRRAICQVIDDIESPFDVCEAASLQDAIELLALSDPVELALLDLNLPDVEGLEGLELLRILQPKCSVVMLSSQADSDTVMRCIEMGAAGFIPKTLAPQAFQAAVQQVADGGVYLPMQAMATHTQPPAQTITQGAFGAASMLEWARAWAAARFSDTQQGHASRGVPAGPTAQAGATPQPAKPSLRDPRDMGLTDRQIDVLDLLLAGHSNKVICRRLKLAEGTIKVHISAVFRALGVRSRTQAIVAAVKMGLKVGD
jgi:DNA-binding NarL/FixJ family response regulator